MKERERKRFDCRRGTNDVFSRSRIFPFDVLKEFFSSAFESYGFLPREYYSPNSAVVRDETIRRFF